ncbi:protein SET DOMAIN GROUP 40 isoform X1 [Malania oleifera]|uniref:protein SET DOMAIN GROUP 40 isoform X1 n=1 Tax=Malania oleifera TaxID=397392 RepID=UPI0025ADAA6F|nr:protein SET DOMAIN GROUP 40 isoform X1 [Malania oleifera]
MRGPDQNPNASHSHAPWPILCTRGMMELEQQNHLERFLKWAAKLGISDSSTNTVEPEIPVSSCLGHTLSVSNFPDAGGRGLAAVRDLRKGELILRVPKSALLTRENLLKDENLSLTVKKHASLSSSQILAVCLLAEMDKGKSSCCYPYLMQLPRSYGLLASFGQCEMQALQVEDAIWTAEKAALKVKLEWEEASALMQKLRIRPQLQTLKAWVWAFATISSRTLHIPWDDAGCLCPVGDLFNYAPPGDETYDFGDLGTQMHASSLRVGSFGNGQATGKSDLEQFDAQEQRLIDAGYEEDVAAYCFYARKYYKRGEQVLLSYGMYTNLDLLEHYGFLLNENPNEKVFIPLEPDIYSFSSWSNDSMYIKGNGKPSFALLSALRLWAAPPRQRRSVGHLAYSGSQLSTENEICIMNSILEKCHIILKNLPTSFEEDSLLLCGVNKMQDLCSPVELKKVLSDFKGELHTFFETYCLQSGEGGTKLDLSEKTRSSIDRWKLAVQWRMRYKEALLDCIVYCSEIIDRLSCQNIQTGMDNLVLR